MKPSITLLHHTPLEVCSHAIRTCWSSFDKGDCGGEKDKELINRVGNVYKHASVLESLVYSFFIQGISRACYSDDTEILTNNGFKLFKDLNKNDLVATMKENGEVVFQQPTDYIEYDYNGYMHHYRNQVIDCLVTPNHRMLFKKVDVRINKDKIHYQASEDINFNKIKFLKTLNFSNQSNLPDIFSIPFEPYCRKNKIGGTYLVNKDDMKIEKNAFLDLLAMYISDGNTHYCKKENKFTISITKPHKKELVKNIINNVGLNPLKNKDNIRFNSRHLGIYFKKIGRSFEKYIPLNIFDFSKEDAIRFLDTYSKFDGHKKKGYEIYTIFTTSKILKEQIYILCLIAGYSPTINITDNVGKIFSINGVETKCNHICYYISFSKRKHRNIESNIKISKQREYKIYNGKVYCVSVPNGNLYVRRNNKGMWCGNCLQELARHRIASYSVKSSRYTLAELKRADISTLEKASKFIKLTSNDKVNQASHKALQNLKELLLDSSTTNDVAKYAMPECYLTELTWTINARSLQNFLTLRTSKHALWEIQELALCIYEALPQEHKYLFDKCVESGDK